MSKRTYTITNATEVMDESGTATLQVAVSAVTQIGTRNDEEGNEIPIERKETIMLQIPVSKLPSIEKNIPSLILAKAKEAFHAKEASGKKYKSLLGKATSETISLRKK